MRAIELITGGVPTSVGPLQISQPLPVAALRYADPFLLLHHAGPQFVEPSSDIHKIEAHPHRGFEPVTFVYQGSVLHRDSLGNSGIIGAGEVQWITSGSGIIHEEGPTPALAMSGGDLELIQLWVNLPAHKKMMAPAYQELHAAQLPRVTMLDGALELTLVAGTLGAAVGPAVTQSPVTAAMGWMKAGGSGILPLPAYSTVLLYILGGSVKVGDHVVGAKHLVLFDGDISNTEVPIEILSDGHLLLMGGEPLGEPVASHGPFVMNTEDEIRTAFRDYAGGKFGSL